jgi:hypothetical protein
VGLGWYRKSCWAVGYRLTPNAKAIGMTHPTKSDDVKDIGLAELEGLNWGDLQAEASLESVASFARDHARRVVNWYLDKKSSKRFGAHVTRGAAIVLIVVAGLVPLLGEIGTLDGHPWINPLWTSVMLVLAGGCIGLDRFSAFPLPTFAI